MNIGTNTTVWDFGKIIDEFNTKNNTKDKYENIADIQNENKKVQDSKENNDNRDYENKLALNSIEKEIIDFKNNENQIELEKDKENILKIYSFDTEKFSNSNISNLINENVKISDYKKEKNNEKYENLVSDNEENRDLKINSYDRRNEYIEEIEQIITLKHKSIKTPIKNRNLKTKNKFVVEENDDDIDIPQINFSKKNVKRKKGSSSDDVNYIK